MHADPAVKKKKNPNQAQNCVCVCVSVCVYGVLYNPKCANQNLTKKVLSTPKVIITIQTILHSTKRFIIGSF